jgi:hypothetical protein
MEILSEKKNQDGSVTFEMYFEEDEKQILINFAVNRLLKDFIEKETKNAKKPKKKKETKNAKKPKKKK